MRVLVLSPGFPVADRPAYAPGVVDTFAALAERHELEVHAITNARGFGMSSYRGIDVFRYGYGPRVERALGLAAVAKKRHRARAFDVVWSLWVDRTGAAAVSLSRLLGVPAVLSVMGGELASIPELGYGYATTAARRAWLATMLSLAARVTVGSSWLAEQLTERLEAVLPSRVSRRVRVTPLGVPAERIARRCVAPWSEGQVLRLVAVGDLSPVKRPMFALDVVKSLVERGVHATLDVFGPARADEVAWFAAGACERGIEARVVHHGFIAAAELYARLASYDVLLHASAHESQGAALIEAALAELPIACAGVGVASRLSALGAPIELAAPERDAFAAAVLQVARRRSSTGTHARLVAEYAVAPAAKRFEDVLREAAS